MENQNTDKTKSNIGISLLTGCGTSLAVFVGLAALFIILIFWLVGNESMFAVSLFLGLIISVVLGLVGLIVGGVIVFRAKQPRPVAFGLLSWAGMSILINIVIVWLGFSAQNFIQYNTPDTIKMLNYFDILRGVEFVIILVADVLAIVVGWLVYRSQRSKLDKAEPVG